MHYPGYDTGKIKLTEGEWFTFRIHNLLQLQDNEWYYILEDINGLKHFMPAGYYESYGLKTGDEILCKVDRINCTGRVFLEPQHPEYKAGEVYNFTIEETTNIDTENAVTVKDILGNSIEVQLFDDINSGVRYENQVRCLVKSIKKGKPVLEICRDII